MRWWGDKIASNQISPIRAKSRTIVRLPTILFATSKSGWPAKPRGATVWSGVFNEVSASSKANDRTLQSLQEELETTRHEFELIEAHLDEVVGQPRLVPEAVLNLSG